MIEKKTQVIEENSVYPYYIIALTWIIWSLCFPLISLFHYAALILLSVVEYIVGISCFKKTRRIIETEVEIDISDASTNDLIRLGKKYITDIKMANDLIIDNILTAKINDITTSCEGILKVIADSPNEVSKIRKFLTYYLPTCVKLLNAYAEYAAMDIESDNIKKTKIEIEKSLEMIDKSFKKLLDSLYSDELLDISTDIAAFEKVLAVDGILEKER